MIDDGGLLLLRLEPREAAFAVLANDEPALRIEHQAIRALLPETGGRREHAARLQEDFRFRLPFLPLVDDVLRHIREQERAILPDRPFAPVEALAELLDLRIGRDEL